MVDDHDKKRGKRWGDVGETFGPENLPDDQQFPSSANSDSLNVDSHFVALSLPGSTAAPIPPC